MIDVRGYQSATIPTLSPVLRRWIEANEKYGQVCRWRDVPWGYNERASLSTLAAAFWLAGGIALEEYFEIKGSRERKTGGKRPSTGRCDLYASCRNGHYVFEAKILWTSLRGEGWKKTIDAKLKAARTDAQRTRTHIGERKLALLFIMPYLPGKKVTVSDALISRFVDYLKKRKDMCSAWIFPKSARNFSWSTDGGWRYPGTAVLIKPLRSSRQ